MSKIPGFPRTSSLKLLVFYIRIYPVKISYRLKVSRHMVCDGRWLEEYWPWIVGEGESGRERERESHADILSRVYY